MSRMIQKCLFLLMLLLCISCEHKPLCYDHTHDSNLYVVFNWENASDEMTRPLMAVYFYPADQKTPYKFFLSGKSGGKVRLPAGFYNVLCYNDDVDELYVNEEEGFFNVLGYTRVLSNTYDSVTRDEPDTDEEDSEDDNMKEDEPTISSSGKLLVGDSYTFFLDDDDGIQTLTLTPFITSCHYTCEIKLVENAKYLSSIRCAITGLSKSIQLFDRQTVDEAAEMLFPMNFQGEGLYGETETFGALPMEHTLRLTMKLSDGSIQEAQFDVTKQVNEAPDPQVVHLVIDQLTIRKPENDSGSSGGFQADVGGWTDWTIEVEMRK